MRRGPCLAVVLLAAVLGGCGGGGGAAPDGLVCGELSGPRRLAEGIIAADNRRDLAAVLDHYHPETAWWPPQGQPVRGRDSLRPRYERLFADSTPELTTEVERTCSSGALAWVEGRVDGRLVSRADGRVTEVEDEYLIVAVRDEVGRWRIRHLVWR